MNKIKPKKILLVINATSNTDRTELLSKTIQTLSIEKEQVVIYEATDLCIDVSKRIQTERPCLVIYFETTASITEVYKKGISSMENCPIQFGVRLKGKLKNCTIKSHSSFTVLLGNLRKFFGEKKENTPSQQAA